MLIPILAQDTATPADPNQPAPWWHILLEQGFLVLVIFIFLTAIITLIIQQRRRDKCLKFLDNYHVTILTTSGKALWGDLIVYAKALELVFDAPYTTSRGLVKTSALLYESDLDKCLAICRPVDGLSAKEKVKRERQIKRSFKPNLIRKSFRWFRNLLNTLRDAFSKALTALIGQMTKAKPGGFLAQQKSGVDQIGQTFLSAAGNAYEPMLERHIGSPVVVQLQSPSDPDKKPIELPGYLVDYTDKWLCLFNVGTEPVEERTWTLNDGDEIEQPGYHIKVTNGRLGVKCTGPEALIVKNYKTDDRYAELEVGLTNGCGLELGCGIGSSVEVTIERTRRIDIVCPRSQATIHFGGDLMDDNDRLIAKAPDQTSTDGCAPEPIVEDMSDDPVE